MFLISYLSHAYQHSIQQNHNLSPNQHFHLKPIQAYTPSMATYYEQRIN